jgi:hypothetical protein
MDGRRLGLLVCVAGVLIPAQASTCEAGWLTGREGRFRPFRLYDPCATPCLPVPCVPIDLCECLPIFAPPPCAPPSIIALPDAGPVLPPPLSGSAGAWNLSPTGHPTAFLVTTRGAPGIPVQPPPYGSFFPPDYGPPGGFGPPGVTPPGSGFPPVGGPPGGPPSGPPQGPPGKPPNTPPGVETPEVPAPPALVLAVMGAVGIVAFRRRIFSARC